MTTSEHLLSYPWENIHELRDEIVKVTEYSHSDRITPNSQWNVNGTCILAAEVAVCDASTRQQVNILRKTISLSV